MRRCKGKVAAHRYGTVGVPASGFDGPGSSGPLRYSPDGSASPVGTSGRAVLIPPAGRWLTRLAGVTPLSGAAQDAAEWRIAPMSGGLALTPTHYRLEAGADPRMGTAAKLALALNVSIGELFGEAA